MRKPSQALITHLQKKQLGHKNVHLIAQMEFNLEITHDTDVYVESFSQNGQQFGEAERTTEICI